MSDYIKREDAIKEANTWSVFGNDNLESRLKRLPSADVVEVRHGHWTITHPPKYIRLDRRTDMMECSECGHQIFRKTGEIVNYCPNCGARMIREEQEHDREKDYPCYLDYPLREEQEHED